VDTEADAASSLALAALGMARMRDEIEPASPQGSPQSGVGPVRTELHEFFFTTHHEILRH
jgi:hypothetical protein